MKRILTSFAFVAASLAFAQVGVNAGDTGLPAIADDAVFQVSNKGGEKKGVLFPSVSLTAVDDKATTSNGANTVTTGLMVWNDGQSGLTPAGYYYWNGANWILTGNVDAGNNYKNVEKVTSTGTFTSSANSDLIVNTSGGSVVIDLTASEIVGKEVCVFQKDDGDIDFSKPNMKGQSITFASNVGGCYTWDGENWVGTFNY